MIFAIDLYELWEGTENFLVFDSGDYSFEEVKEILIKVIDEMNNEAYIADKIEISFEFLKDEVADGQPLSLATSAFTIEFLPNLDPRDLVAGLAKYGIKQLELPTISIQKGAMPFGFKNGFFYIGKEAESDVENEIFKRIIEKIKRIIPEKLLKTP